MATSDMYRENILDHYKHPRNRGKIAHADAEAHDSNPLCGDDITYRLKIENGRVSEIKFEGSACAICLASSSMLAEEIAGKPLERARAYRKEELLSMLGIDPGPMRLKCALLPLKVLKLAVYKYLGKQITEEDEKLV